MPFQTSKLVFATSPEDGKFTNQELEFLLLTLKDCTFKGHDIELLYNLIIKIQKQYIDNQTEK